MVTLEFVRTMDGIVRHDRQSQTWRRFLENGGRKVVSAHVSVLASEPLRPPSPAVPGLPGWPTSAER